jgi:hypothetical protein
MIDGNDSLVLTTEDDEDIIPGWDYVKRFFAKDIFEGSCKKIQDMAEGMEDLPVLERVIELANLFNTFKNPDKETVLTPFRVVNMQIAKTLGGLRFVDETMPHGKYFTNKFEEIVDENGSITKGKPRNMTQLDILSTPGAKVTPKWVESEFEQRIWGKKNLKILDPNSKTCLYPLFAAASIYAHRIISNKIAEGSGESVEEWINVVGNDIVKEDDKGLWKEIVESNIFVNARVDYSRKIAKRVLCGFRDMSPNISVVDLMEIVKDNDIAPERVAEKFKEKMCEQFSYKNEEGEDMKFDAIVGNPPYQETTENNKMSRSIYNDFVQTSAKIADIVTMVTPARWMGGELGPYNELSGFLDFMTSGHLKYLCDFPNSQDVFNAVDIKGGTCFYLYDTNYSGACKYSITENGISEVVTRSLKNPVSNIIIRFPELLSISDKVFKEPVRSMKELVSSWNPFGFISDLFTKNNDGVRLSETKVDEDDYLIYGLFKTKRTTRYIPNNALTKNISGAKNWKVFIPRANGSGAFGEVFSSPMLGSPMLGSPMQICTDTFLQVCEFENKSEAESLLKYVKTKFFRAMVGIKKIAVFNYKDAFTFVPVQDYRPINQISEHTNSVYRFHGDLHGTRIDWSKSIREIDQQLYKKYNLDQTEIDFIETRVKEMS